MDERTSMPALTNSECIDKLLKFRDRALTRKFGPLGYSLLLRFQTELTTLQNQIGGSLVADIDLQEPGASGVMLSPEASAEEKQLVEELHKKLKSYYEFLWLFIKVQSTKKPDQDTLDDFVDFLYFEGNVDYKHSSWSDVHDLVAPFTSHLHQDHLTTKIMEMINTMRKSDKMKALLDKLPDRIRRRVEELPSKYTPREDEKRIVLDTKTISKICAIIMTFVVPALIVGPMFALYAITSTWWRMAALWIFSAIFAFMTWYLAGTTLDVIFTTTAAFLAVLVVFVGSAPTGPQ